FYAGTVYKLAPSGDFTVLHEFGPDRATPYAGLIQDSAGNLYGTTGWGGAFGAGMVYKLAPSGDFTVLHEFGPDRATPYGGLIQDSAGNLYGTTQYGGASNAGTVYKLAPSGDFTVLHAFDCYAGGAAADAGLPEHSAGMHYSPRG